MRWLMSLLVLLSFVQTPGKRPEFDVVDIKLNASGSPDGVGEILPSGQFRASDIPVRELIKFAFNIRNEALVGSPGWVDTERYDVFGKAPAAGTEETPSGARIPGCN